MPKKSQKDMILIHLQMYGTITSWEAIEKFRATRLSGIIFNLKEEGHNISSKTENRDGKHWAVYTLHQENKQGQFELL